jgi:hypothetical protein
MAEFLIYNKDHWSKSVKLTPEQVERFKGCYKNGDVVEVREDGYWDKRGFDKEAFRVVKKAGLALKDALHYTEPLRKITKITAEDKSNEYETLARRKYQITNTALSDSKIATVSKLSVVTKTELSISND